MEHVNRVMAPLQMIAQCVIQVRYSEQINHAKMIALLLLSSMVLVTAKLATLIVRLV